MSNINKFFQGIKYSAGYCICKGNQIKNTEHRISPGIQFIELYARGKG
jgi:hypothetical protein